MIAPRTPQELDVHSSLAGIVILAGGASVRMGSPKAQLLLPTQQTLLDYHIEAALSLSVPIMIADNGQQFLVADRHTRDESACALSTIEDYQPQLSKHPTHSEGPLVAIMAALQVLAKTKTTTACAPWLMVISCDSLITAPMLWQRLCWPVSTAMSAGRTSDPTSNPASNPAVWCLTDHDHVYPLLGLYHQQITPRLQAYLDRGQRRVMPFMTPIAQSVALDPAWQPLANFNTPKAFMAACAAVSW